MCARKVVFSSLTVIFISFFSDIESYMSCVVRHASGCDWALHWYLDQYLLDLEIYNDVKNCEDNSNDSDTPLPGIIW